MRRLLYVPVIHDPADLGSAGAALSQRSAAVIGERLWALHQETVGRFWQVVTDFLRSFDPRQICLYQDGLAADGEVGRRVVQQAAKLGSRNYQLLLDLLNDGAELRKTEEPRLLRRERQALVSLLGKQLTAEEPEREQELWRRQRDRLLKERDRSIAEAINGTLQEGQIGVLFLGAEHDISSWLAADVAIRHVKDRQQVWAYFQALFLTGNDGRLAELASYLTSPVEVP